MVLCDICGKRQGTHKSKLAPNALKRGKKYAAYCDGCWRICRSLGKPIHYGKGASRAGERKPGDTWED